MTTSENQDDEGRAIAALLKAGRDDEARRRVDAGLAAGNPSDAVLAFAGMLAARAGDAAGAAEHLQALLDRRPDDRATRLNLAGALIALERFDRIAPLFARLPREPAIDRLEAFAALRLGEREQARSLYRRVVAAWRDDADSWANLAAAEADEGRYDAAISALEEAITVRRDDTRFYLALADVLERADRREERLKVMRDVAAIAPTDGAVQLALGLAAAAADDTQAAEAALRRAIVLAPTEAAAYLELGLILETQNRLHALDDLIEEARGRLGGEIALLEAWSAFRHGRLDDAETLAQSIPDTVNDLRRAQLRAQIAERRGDPAAFELFAQMNAAAVRISPRFTGASYRDIVVAETAAFRAERWPTVEIDQSDGVPQPVFVMGFPRSGTTLIDTLLGQLPDTHVLEEQPLIPSLQHAVGSMARLSQLDRVTIADLRSRYRAMLEELAPGASALRVVDKHPLHMARMPLIDRLFPSAPVLLVERHPCDVVLSCFMANFRLNHAMRSFTDLEEAARTYDAVFTAWSEAEERLPLNVHRVRYERLVATPAQEMRAALRHIGASYDANILDNVAGAQARGPVRTASYSQVGEPIYQRAVARWHRYREALSPVLPILAPWAERMGYET